MSLRMNNTILSTSNYCYTVSFTKPYRYIMDHINLISTGGTRLEFTKQQINKTNYTNGEYLFVNQFNEKNKSLQKRTF